MARIGKNDAIVALSDPDWVFSYAWGERSRVLKITHPGDMSSHFGQELVAPDQHLEEKIDGVLRSGHAAVFAADALFRSSLLEPAVLDSDAAKLFNRLSRRYKVEIAWVSPGGQHYFPLRSRS